MYWEDYKKAFEFDDFWRDIYVTETELKDWKAVLEFLAEGHYPVRYLVNDVETPLTTNGLADLSGQKRKQGAAALDRCFRGDARLSFFRTERDRVRL